jgi:glycosyl-4,4'-diaponeurosporenoate acyltransferase
MTMSELIWLIVIDIAVVIAIAVTVGVLAPRLSHRRLQHDRFLLRTWSWETPQRYRAWHVPWLAAHLPELGSVFGGTSKSTIPGTNRDALLGYLREVRRAEIVHWVSFWSWIALVWFNPWWLTLVFAVIVMGGNTPFLMILRFNKLRLQRLINQ